MREMKVQQSGARAAFRHTAQDGTPGVKWVPGDARTRS
jgi:hypothetical protein